MKQQEELGKYFSLLMKLGVGMVVSILGCFLVGLFIEKWLKTGGIILILFTLLGVVFGFVFLIKELLNEPKDT